MRICWGLCASTVRRIPDDGLGLYDFVSSRFIGATGGAALSVMAMGSAHLREVGAGWQYFLETYGCQMNVADSELVRGIMDGQGFGEVKDASRANVIMLNTCSIRERAESRVFDRLLRIRSQKRRRERAVRPVVCVLGCMAERLKTRLLEEDDLVDVVIGPDSYRDLPRLLAAVRQGDRGAKAYNVQLSTEETYADLRPVRTAGNGVSAFVSVMRGCANMCTYCIVPYTRGRERSRPFGSILDEIRVLLDQGYKEVVLLGQNVNSYNDVSLGVSDTSMTYTEGFRTIYRPPPAGRRFPELVDAICRLSPNLRVRFTSPHPKDFPDDLISLYGQHANLCPQIHLPAQSGSDAVLERMGRGYTSDAYVNLTRKLRACRPDLALSSDFITGFCGETEEDHQATLDLVRSVELEYAFVFPYSPREKTRAARHLTDDVPQKIKTQRVQDITKMWRTTSLARNARRNGSIQEILIEGNSDLSDGSYFGRTPANTAAVLYSDQPVHPGDCVRALVYRTAATTLYCKKVGTP